MLRGIVVHENGWQDGRMYMLLLLLIVVEFLDFRRTTKARTISVTTPPRSSYLAFPQWWRWCWRCFHQLVKVLLAYETAREHIISVCESN